MNVIIERTFLVWPIQNLLAEIVGAFVKYLHMFVNYFIKTCKFIIYRLILIYSSFKSTHCNVMKVMTSGVTESCYLYNTKPAYQVH